MGELWGTAEGTIARHRDLIQYKATELYGRKYANTSVYLSDALIPTSRERTLERWRKNLCNRAEISAILQRRLMETMAKLISYHLERKL